MSSPPTHYTDLNPKRGDITGLNYQAFGKGEDVVSYVIGGIKAKTIAAIGTCAPGLSIVQYLYSPRIHHDLGGEPKLIVGNASNKMGEFSCVYIPLTAMRMYVYGYGKEIGRPDEIHNRAAKGSPQRDCVA